MPRVSHVSSVRSSPANMRAVILLALLAVAWARPQEQTTTPIPIIRSQSEVNGDGSYKFSFETGNGIKRDEVGSQKQITPEESGQVQQGSYSYTAPDGQVISLSFVADENGFVPTGDHLPTPVPVPPLPPAIARALAQIERANSGPGAHHHHN